MVSISALKNSSRFKTIFWFFVATVIFGALVLAADPSKILSSLYKAKMSYIALAFVTGFIVINCWAFNWYVFFRALEIDCNYLRTFQLFTAGQFFNNITPLGRFGGQPIMAYLISKNSGSSYEKSLAAVMSADLVTVIPMTVYILSGLSFVVLARNVSGRLTSASLLLLLFLLTGVFIGFIGWFRSGTIEKYSVGVMSALTTYTGRGHSLLEELKSRVENWESTLQTIGENPVTLIYSVSITGSAFLFRMITFYLVLTSLGLQMHPLEIMLLVPLISFATISPTPGSAGTYEAAMAATIMLLMDVNLATALTVTVLYRIATYWQTLVVGYVSTTTLGKFPSKAHLPDEAG